MSGAQDTRSDLSIAADDNRRGALWLVADMVLVVTMLAVVKHEAATYSAIQLVFLRSIVGLVMVLPLAWRHRAALFGTRRTAGHLVRVGCNTLALTCNFAAVAALPLALVTAIGFTRPLVLLALAAAMLGERVSGVRWAATAVGFVGVLIMTRPGTVPWNLGLLAAFGSVVFGSLAIIQTRRLRNENAVVLMLFYTVGLTVLTAIPAAYAWVPVAAADWPALLVIGVLAQLGQYCFLRAHQIAATHVLAPLGYLSIVLSVIVGYVAFGEVPRWQTMLGIAIILATTHLVGRLDRPAR